jgi:hypothetical protein
MRVYPYVYNWGWVNKRSEIALSQSGLPRDDGTTKRTASLDASFQTYMTKICMTLSTAFIGTCSHFLDVHIWNLKLYCIFFV